MQAGLVAAALFVALWSARGALASAASRRTGEIVWSMVAVIMLVAVSTAVRIGSSRGL